MAIKLKEIKDNAIIEIKVNKNFYLMVKAASFYLYQLMDKEKIEEYLKDIATKEYKDLDELQQSFYVNALLLAEIEKQAKESNQTVDKEILEPGDEGYKPVNLD
jgi:hypothetical protein